MEPTTAPWVALMGHDYDTLTRKANNLKQTDGEGWAIGQEVLNFVRSEHNPPRMGPAKGTARFRLYVDSLNDRHIHMRVFDARGGLVGPLVIDRHDAGYFLLGAWAGIIEYSKDVALEALFGEAGTD